MTTTLPGVRIDGGLTVALAGNVRVLRFGARPDEPLRLSTDAFSVEEAKKEGVIEVDVSMFVRRPNTGDGSSSRGSAAALISGDASTGDAPLLGVELPPFAGTPAAARVVAMTAPEALACAFEYGFEMDGVAYAPPSQWHAQARIAAWKRVSSCEWRRMTSPPPASRTSSGSRTRTMCGTSCGSWTSQMRGRCPKGSSPPKRR